MIHFSNPAALWWALLAVPIVLLYLRRTRARRLPVATGFLWAQALQTQAGRSRWRPWRGPVSLVLQLSILGMLVLATAGAMVDLPRQPSAVPERVPESSSVTPEGEARAEAKAYTELWRVYRSFALPCTEQSPIAGWLVVAAGVALAIEWWLFHRRWTC